jgi:hypothetical protein
MSIKSALPSCWAVWPLSMHTCCSTQTRVTSSSQAQALPRVCGLLKMNFKASKELHSMYTTTPSMEARLIVSLGASHNHDPTRYVKFAYSLDDAEPVTVRSLFTVPPYQEGEEWRKAVVKNGWTSTIELGAEIAIGAQELPLWLLEPGVVLQKVVLDLGGYKTTVLGSPESIRI